MTTISLFDAKAHLSRLVDDLVSGREERIVISRHGKPVVSLEPIRVMDVTKRIGIARGRFTVPESIDRSNKTIAALFAGKKVSR